MVLYNTTQLEEANNLFTIFEAINELSNKYLASFSLVIITLFLIILFRRSQDFKKDLLGSWFISSIVALLFWALQLIALPMLIIYLVVLLILIFINIFGGN